MSVPKLPQGVERDDTEHGRLYYTRAQMLAYGIECAKHEFSEKLACLTHQHTGLTLGDAVTNGLTKS
jgi:isocitrate lyase